MPRIEIMKRNLIGKKVTKNNENIKDQLYSTVGRQNELNGKCK